MEPDQEFREFAELFLSHGVKFMIIGSDAHPVASSRYKDLGDLEALEKLSD